METRPKEKSFGIPSFAIHATRGLLRDQAVRRKIMFATILIALGMMVLGSTFLQGALSPAEHPVWFILFWFVCAWLTLLALLLALFDVLLVRAQSRAARRALGEQFSESERSRPSGDKET